MLCISRQNEASTRKSGTPQPFCRTHRTESSKLGKKVLIWFEQGKWIRFFASFTLFIGISMQFGCRFST